MNGGWLIPKAAVPQPEDLHGSVISFLTVIRRAGNYGIYNGWICRCTCGEEVTKQTTYLQTARAKNLVMACDSCLKRRRAERKREVDREIQLRVYAKNKAKKAAAPVVEKPMPPRSSRMCTKCCGLAHRRPANEPCSCGWTRNNTIGVTP